MPNEIIDPAASASISSVDSIRSSNMLLHCVRHGESQFNCQGRIQGQLDPPLSELGMAQAELLAEALAKRPITAVVSSPLVRARQTAEPLARRLGVDMLLMPELMEIHAGCFQGLTWPEIRARFPDLESRWKSHDPDFRVDGGETRRELMARGAAALRKVRELPHAEVAVVTHGGLLGAALKALLQIPAELNPFRFYNTGLNTLAWNGQIKLLRLNDAEHLRSLGQEMSMGDL